MLLGAEFRDHAAEVEAPRRAPAPSRGDGPALGQAVELTLERSLELLARLLRDVTAQDFQQELGKLQVHDAGEFRAKLGVFFALQTSGTITEFGFSLDKDGFERMFAAVFRHREEERVREAARQVERALRLGHGMWFALEEPSFVLPDQDQGPAAAQLAQPEHEVEVRVRHAISGAEVRVVVSSAATFGDIRKALARSVGSGEVLERGRLVRRSGGDHFVSYKDGEPLGGKRRLLLMGADLPADLPGAAEDQEEEEDHADEDEQADQAAGSARLTTQQGRDLQRELRDAFGSADFQRELRVLRLSQPRTSRRFQQEFRRMVLAVQGQVLPRYGLEGTPKGVMQMLEAFGPLGGDAEIQRAGPEIDRLLGLPPDPTAETVDLSGPWLVDVGGLAIEMRWVHALDSGAVSGIVLIDGGEQPLVGQVHGDRFEFHHSDVTASGRVAEGGDRILEGAYQTESGGGGHFAAARKEEPEPAPKPGRSPKEATELEVVLRHALEDMPGELRVTVPAGSTIGAVQEAVLSRLGNSQPGARDSLRLVRRAGDMYMYMYVCVYIYIYICMYVCVYVYIDKQINK